MKKIALLILCTFLLICLASCGTRTKCDKDCSCGESFVTTPESQEGEYDIQKDLEADFKTDNEIEAKFEADSIRQISNAYSSGCKDNPEISIDSDDPIVIAKEYARLLNSEEWTGCSTTYKNFDVSEWYGEIFIDDEPTGIKSEEIFLYDKIKEYYLSGEWDGSPTTMDGHTIERSKSSGHIIVDGYLSRSYQEDLDLPENLDYDNFDSNLWYVPYLGTAVIDHQILKMYVRGELITLPGGELVYEGIDLTYYTPIEYFLCPYEEYNRLFLIVSAVPNNILETYGIEYFSNMNLYDSIDYNDDIPFNKVKRYLYIFPDPTISKIELVSEFSNWYIFKTTDSNAEWYYVDTSGVRYEYQNSVENYGFVQLE